MKYSRIGVMAGLCGLAFWGCVLPRRVPMSPRVVVANPYVESARTQAAVLRGPLVYALKSPDLPAGVRISQISLEPKTLFRAHFERNVLKRV